MQSTLAQTIIETLAAAGVKRIFGIPGGGSSLALIEAADHAGIDFVLTRGETAAAIMAAVTGELSGNPGVVLTGIGPGAASAVNGVAYAHLEKAPLLHFTDGPAASLHQAFDQLALYAPISKAQMQLRPQGARAAMASAIAKALALPRGPVQIELTAADAALPVSGAESGVVGEAESTAAGAMPHPGLADSGSFEAAIRCLAASRKPLLLVGAEARSGDGPDALRRLCEALGCPVMPTYKAKGVLPDSHAQCIGHFTGATAEAAAVRAADLLIFFGLDLVEMIAGDWLHSRPILALSPAPTEALPAPPVGQVTAPLGEIVDRLLPHTDRSRWSAAEIAALHQDLRDRLRLAGQGHTAESIAEALNEVAPEGCRFTIDAGAHMFAVMARLEASEAFGVLKSNGLSTMGFALPAAIAAALEQPARPVAAIIGDGGMMMCLAELATAVERQLPLVVLVANDAALALIDVKQQRQQFRNRGVRTREFDFAAAARALGCRAWRLGEDDALAPCLQEAFAGEGPALLDIRIDASGYAEQLSALRG